MSLDDVIALPAYGIPDSKRRDYLLVRLRELTAFHYAHSEPYRAILDGVWGGLKNTYASVEAIPFLPVSLFKKWTLSSIADDRVFKILTSSGTTGSSVSRVYLDRETARAQSIVLMKIMQHFLGKQRRPMIIADHRGVISDRASYSARGAGIVGAMQFGKQPLFALDSEMNLDTDSVTRYVEAHHNEPMFVFGFTFMLWKYFVRVLAESGNALSVPDAVLFHTGGWKKLESEKVTADVFRDTIRQTLGISDVRNYYGMAEQVGSIFVENDKHVLIPSSYSDIIIRDARTLKPQPVGVPGIIEVVSMLPQSYPGHALLTEDIGVMHAPGNFSVLGRVPKAELRGCSDTFVA